MLWFVPISEGACLVVLQVLVLCEIRQEHERRRGLSEFGGTQVWCCVSPVLNGGFAVVRIGRGAYFNDSKRAWNSCTLRFSGVGSPLMLVR